MKLKYIIIDNLFPVIASCGTEHQAMAKVGGSKPITGAGFCSVDTIIEDGHHAKRWFIVHVYGESVGLGIKSKPTDSCLLEKMFNSTYGC